MNKNLPNTGITTETNPAITTIIEAFNDIIKMAEDMGYPIKLYPESETSLYVYYHDDHPNMILVDKYRSK